MNNEVELVLVGDNNDFVDPLDLGVEYDDLNDEVKLQLDDDIEDEPEFQIGADLPEIISIDENDHRVSVKRERSVSLESFDCDVRYDDTDSDDYFNDAAESKRNVKNEKQPVVENQLKNELAADSVITKTEVTNKEASPAEWIDEDDISESDYENDQTVRKRKKKSAKKVTATTTRPKPRRNVKKEKEAPKTKKEPTEPRVYKHKKDYRKLLQQYEAMVSSS